MSDSHVRSLKASKTIKEKYGEDFYKRIGQKGGKKKGILKGFAFNPKLASIAGRKGGKISKRGKAKVIVVDSLAAYQKGKKIKNHINYISDVLETK